VIRVLVAEDSAVTREYLVHLIERDPGVALAGLARNGEEAVELARSERPDVILMDVHMPRLDGYQATRLIMESTPTPIVMATASQSEVETHGGFHALQAGALVLVDKPPGPGDPSSEAGARELIRTLKLMSEVKVVRRWAARPRATAPAPAAPPGTAAPRALAIGASTGGPPVVAELLRTLPSTVTTPVLVVQHIGAGFAAGFAEWLAAEVPRPVKLAEHGEPAQPGTVYVAPGAAHLGLTRGGRIALDRGVARHGFRPSISHLFDSVAAACGPAAVGILLTGMGRDGADGLRRLRDAGALTVAQDEATCIVYGMPREAVRLNAARHVLPPAEIATLLRSLNGSGRHA
jgi:two-component system, chemotaxis family, protein-glutamate methylesterase/glutaminase